MDMDKAIGIMAVLIVVFGVTMMGLGHVMTGGGGMTELQVDKFCRDTGADAVVVDTYRDGRSAVHNCRR